MYVALLLLAKVCLALCTEIYRITLLDDLLAHRDGQQQTNRYAEFTSGRFRKMAFHTQSNSIFVATNHSIIRLSIPTLVKLDEVSWSTSRECEKNAMMHNSCGQRTITLMVPVASSVTSGLARTGLYACWTDGVSCECSLRSASNLKGPPKAIWKGNENCPQLTDNTVVGLVSSEQSLFFTSTFDKEVAILKVTIGTPMGGLKIVRTAARSNWITQDSNTKFVYSYEFHNAVYFIFRELSNEIKEQCGKRMIVSRVGRICLNDDGGRNNLLSSFSKVTFLCEDTFKGSPSLVHTHVQAVYVDTPSKTIFATFTTPPTMPASSIICTYKMTDIEESFQGPFVKSNGEKTNIKRTGNCEKSDINSWFDHHLMFNVVRPRFDMPNIRKDGERWTHVAVDWMPFTPKSDYNLIIFTVSQGTNLRKWHYFKGIDCLLEDIKTNVFANDESNGLISDMIFQNNLEVNEKHLLLSTTQAVYRIPVARCDRLGHKKSTCHAIHDPYCTWNEQSNKCEYLTQSNSGGFKFETCPIKRPDHTEEITIDGGWGTWASWRPCNINKRILQGQRKHITDLTMSDCACRYRSCTAPRPYGTHAKGCLGDNVEISNCSVDGSWTRWSSWSGCTPECLDVDSLVNMGHTPASRIRQRWCINPPPLGSKGNSCAGDATEKQACPSPSVTCPAERLPPPSWSEWSEWTQCSSQCNDGIQVRQRECGRHEFGWKPLPPSEVVNTDRKLKRNSNELLCLGDAFEERSCNNQSCPLTRILSTWTDWLITSLNHKTGITQRRFRVECEATLPQADKLLSHVEEQVGECREHVNGELYCSEPGHENAVALQDGSLNYDWSEWSECSRACGVGKRWRRLMGTSTLGLEGGTQEEQLCNTHACPGSWGCWSSWSECNMPPCSAERGEQRRHRVCQLQQTTDQLSSLDFCQGGFEQSTESRPCEPTLEETKCQQFRATSTNRFKRGYSENHKDLYEYQEFATWAEWSDCFVSNGGQYQIRVRNLQKRDEYNSIEAKRCDTQVLVQLEEVLDADTIERLRNTQKGRYTWTHAIIATILAALLGIAVVLIPYIGCIARNRKLEENREKRRRSSVWKKLIDRTSNPERNAPYVLVAQTKGPKYECAGDCKSNSSWLKPTYSRSSNLDRIRTLHTNKTRDEVSWNGTTEFRNETLQRNLTTDSRLADTYKLKQRSIGLPHEPDITNYNGKEDTIYATPPHV